MEVQQAIVEDELSAQVRQRSGQLRCWFKQSVSYLNIVGDVRGRGQFVSLNLLKAVPPMRRSGVVVFTPPDGGLCILRGNLSPRGAVLRPSAATPALMHHRARSVVFENFDNYEARFADPDLYVDESCVLVLKNTGPSAVPAWMRLET